MTKNQDAIKFILAAEAVQEAIVANMTIGTTKLFEATKVDASRIEKLIKIARSHIDALIRSTKIDLEDIRTVLDEIRDISLENRKYFDMIASCVNDKHERNSLDLAQDSDLKVVIYQLKIWSDRLSQMEKDLRDRFGF